MEFCFELGIKETKESNWGISKQRELERGDPHLETAPTRGLSFEFRINSNMPDAERNANAEAPETGIGHVNFSPSSPLADELIFF